VSALSGTRRADTGDDPRRALGQVVEADLQQTLGQAAQRRVHRAAPMMVAIGGAPFRARPARARRQAARGTRQRLTGRRVSRNRRRTARASSGARRREGALADPDGSEAGARAAGGVYVRALAAGLAGLERRGGRPFSFALLQRCLILAGAYGWAGYFIAWGLGASGRIGDLALLADPGQPARLVGGLSAVLGPLLALALGRWLGRRERGLKLSLLRRLRRRWRRLRRASAELRYRQLAGLLFGVCLIALLAWLRRADLAAFVLLFAWLAIGPTAGLAAARWGRRRWQKALLGLAGGLGAVAFALGLVLAFAGAGAAAFAFAIVGMVNVAFAGALGVVFELIMGGAISLVLALAGVGVGAMALALIGAGSGIATVTGLAALARAGIAAFLLVLAGAGLATLAFSRAAVAAAAIGAVAACAVAAAIAAAGRGRQGAFAGTLGALLLPTVAAILLGRGERPLAVFAALFLFVLPLLNGLLDWLALSSTGGLAARLAAATGRPRRPWSPTAAALATVAASLAIGLALSALLAFALGLALTGYDTLAVRAGSPPAFDLAPQIAASRADPWGEGLWPSIMLLTPLLPAALYAGLLGALTLGMLLRAPGLSRPAAMAEGWTWLQAGRSETGLSAPAGRWRSLLAALGGLGLAGGLAGLIGYGITASPALDPAAALADLASAGSALAPRWW
jgi:hypothetical protein